MNLPWLSLGTNTRQNKAEHTCPRCDSLMKSVHVCVNTCECICAGTKRGSNKCAWAHMHVSSVLFKSLSLSLETLHSAIYHSTCSLAQVCVLYVIHQASLAWESALSGAAARHMLRSGRRASINRLLILSNKAQTHCTTKADSNKSHNGI